ncbi:MAG TPA: chemotaxis protein CheW [Candidatus Methylacidiphilales bacterium]|nr:chemotaxis protein CheW [Candidatus Methylacidiphilales bacterium]
MKRQLCTFTVGNLLFGVDVLSVQEVLRPQPMTRVPRAPSLIRGLINLRGQILTAVDLRERLGLPAAPPEISGMNVVVQLPGGLAGLLVDQVGEVLDLSAEQFEANPVTLRSTIREVISGVYKLKDRLLLLLDIQAAVTIPAAVSAPIHDPLFSN